MKQKSQIRKQKRINLLILISLILIPIATAIPFQSHPGEQITGEITEAELSCDKILQSELTDDTDFCIDLDTRCDATFPCTTLCLNGVCISSFSEVNQSIDIDSLGPSITGTCTDGFIREIQENGTITCEKVTTADLDFDPGAAGADYCASGTCAGSLYIPGDVKLNHGYRLVFKHSSGSDSQPTSGIISGISSPNSVGIYTSGTTNLLVDADGKVRIGDTATAPAHALGVKTSSDHAVIDISSPTAQISAVDFMEGTAAKWGIGKNAANDFFIDESGVTPSRLMIEAGTGNVGIGKTSPGEKLDVDGNIIASGTICDSYGCISWTPSGLDIYYDLGNVGIGTTSPSGTLHVSHDGSSEDLIVSSTDGNVGIGTTSPGEKLEVNGNIKATSFIGDGSQLTGMEWTESGGDIYRDSGNVGIGTTSPSASYKLDVDGNVRFGEDQRIFSTTAIDILDADAGKTGRLNVDSLHTNGLGSGQIYIEGSRIDANMQIKIGYGEAGGTTAEDVVFGGEVGIGTTSPGATLEVDGTTKLGSSSVPIKYITFFSGGPGPCSGRCCWDVDIGETVIPSKTVILHSCSERPAGYGGDLGNALTYVIDAYVKSGGETARVCCRNDYSSIEMYTYGIIMELDATSRSGVQVNPGTGVPI